MMRLIFAAILREGNMMLALVLLILLWGAPSWAAPVHDASTPSSQSNVQTPNVSHSRGAVCANPVAIIRVSSQDGTPGTLNSVTYGGNSATILPGTTHKAIGSNNIARSIWYYKNPGSGAATVQANFSESMNAVILGVSTYCDVDQTTTFGTAVEAEGASTTPSVTVSSASGELVVDVAAIETGTDTTLTVHVSQTERINANNANNHRQGGSEEAGAASVVMSWTLGAARFWGSTGVALKPAAANTTVRTRMLLGVGN